MPGRRWLDSPNRRTGWSVRLVLLLGLLVGTGHIAATAGTAQPPTDPGLDDRSPLPPNNPKAAAERFRFPNRDAAIYQGRRDDAGSLIPDTGVVDFKPLASQKENADEYLAWTTVVRWAGQFTAAELEDHAARDLTRDDLLGPPRIAARLSVPIRFDGTLTKVRRVPATRALQELGTAEVYESLLVPHAEPPTDVVSMVFTELPAALVALREHPAGEWMDVNRLAAAAGYFFKVKQDAGAAPVPVLVGKSVTLMTDAPPSAAGKHPVALDKDLRVFRLIQDDAAIAKEAENWEEVSAWNRVLLHARRFTPEQLDAHARTDLEFADLFLDSRRDHKLELVKFEGRLLMLKKLEPTRKLRDAGLDALYEGWLVPKDQPSGHPISIVFTDPPEGVEPTGRVNKWVSFAGYSFKLLRYESAEPDPKDPKKKVIKRAPLLLGRAITVLPDPEVVPVSWNDFVRTATVVVVGLLGTALALTWWFRRGDKIAKQEIDTHRARNPFGEQAR